MERVIICYSSNNRRLQLRFMIADSMIRKHFLFPNISICALSISQKRAVVVHIIIDLFEARLKRWRREWRLLCVLKKWRVLWSTKCLLVFSSQFSSLSSLLRHSSPFLLCWAERKGGWKKGKKCWNYFSLPRWSKRPNYVVGIFPHGCSGIPKKICV